MVKKRTIQDVAAAAGVSIATVSRVLNPGDGARVSEKAMMKVKAAVKKLKYHPNQSARSLKTRSTRTVAVIAPELANDFFMDLADGIERELHTRGYTMIIASSANSLEEEQKRISIFIDHMVDGIVLIPVGYHGEHLKAVARRGMPLVLVDRFVKDVELDIILSDNIGGAFALTNRLLSDGFKKIAFVGGNSTISTAQERFMGFAQAMTEAKIRAKPWWVHQDGMGIADGYRGMESILNSRNPAEALVAVNNLVHLGMERKLIECFGKDKPQVVIAAFDKTPYTLFMPACRYIATQDVVTMGEKTGRRILERIEQKKLGQKIRNQTVHIPVSIVESS